MVALPLTDPHRVGCPSGPQPGAANWWCCAIAKNEWLVATTKCLLGDYAIKRGNSERVQPSSARTCGSTTRTALALAHPDDGVEEGAGVTAVQRAAAGAMLVELVGTKRVAAAGACNV